MKKILLLIAAFTGFVSMWGVDIKVSTPDGTFLSDGSVLFSTPSDVFLSDGEVAIYGNLTLTADAEVSAKVSVTLNEGPGMYGVCFTSCFPVQVGKSISTQATLSAASPLSISFEPIMAMNPWTVDEYRTYKFTVAVEGDEGLIKSFPVLVSNDGAVLVPSVNADESSLLVEGSVVKWNLPSVPQTLSIYSLTGQLIEKRTVTEKQGNMNLTLPRGTYLLSVGTYCKKVLLK